jgi:hypothetical protein
MAVVPQKCFSNFLVVALKRVFRFFPPTGWLYSLVSPYSWFRIKLESDFGREEILRTYESFPEVRAIWHGSRLTNFSSERLDHLAFRTLQGGILSLNRRGGFIIKNGHILVPHTGLEAPAKLYFPNTSVAGIVEQSGRHVLLKRGRTTTVIPKGVFAGSMAPHNWFHWLIDNLSTIHFARYLPPRFDDYPLLVAESVTRKPNWLAALDLVSAGRTVLAVDPERPVLVTHLVRLDSVTRPNPRPLRGNAPARISVLEAPLLEFRDFVLAELGLASSFPRAENRIFIGRRPTAARSYNQREIFAAAAGYGFRLVYLEDLDFLESVRIFREADVIIGPHGAGWANLLFCSSETNALLWTWGGEDAENWYENIAYVANVNYRQLNTGSQGAHGVDPRVASFVLDVAWFRKTLEALLPS